jgi:hypothetical protein
MADYDDEEDNSRSDKLAILIILICVGWYLYTLGLDGILATLNGWGVPFIPEPSHIRSK